MFLRRKHITVGGRSYDYYAVVQNVREGGRVRQKTVVHLGKLDLSDSGRVLAWLKGLALEEHRTEWQWTLGEVDQGIQRELQKLGWCVNAGVVSPDP